MTSASSIAALEHVAGAFSLELVNSATGIDRAGFDWLGEPSTAQAWAGSLGLRLGTITTAELAAVREVRETIHRTFRAIADEVTVPNRDLADLGSAYAAGLVAWPLVQQGRAFVRAWPRIDTGPSLIARATDDAFELLRHARLDRVGACERCGWLFLDVSRNGRRRWCSMLSCGAKEKAKRHYQRATGRASTSSLGSA